MRSYYTYLLIDPRSNQPFYAGKGSDRRMYFHWRNRNSSYNHNPHLQQILLELQKANLKPLYEKVLINATETQALNKERELVTQYGRLDLGTGILCNLTDGGQRGASSWSPATREHKRQIELNKHKGRPVSQYTLEGRHIADYFSAKVASECVPGANRSYITQVCKGKRKSAGGFLWTYKGEPTSRFRKAYYRSVIQYSLDGKKLAAFRSLTEAQKATGIELHNISECCRGKSKTAGGFIWQYA